MTTRGERMKHGKKPTAAQRRLMETRNAYEREYRRRRKEKEGYEKTEG